MQTYAEAAAYLAAGRKGQSTEERQLSGRDTRLVRRGPDCIAVQYHSTDVVTYWADGRVMLDTGGWYTATTKERMHGYSPISVWQKSYTWYVSVGKDWQEREANAREFSGKRVALLTSDGRLLVGPDEVFSVLRGTPKKYPMAAGWE